MLLNIILSFEISLLIVSPLLVLLVIQYIIYRIYPDVIEG